MKQCIKCGQHKLPSEYYVHKSSKSGLQGSCKECVKAKTRLWNANNKDQKHYQSVKAKYNLDKQQYFKKLEIQHNKCAICKNELAERPHVDHCHNTGKVRGLLCRYCNLLLGYAKDNEKTLQNAIKYLHTSHNTQED